MGNFPSFKIYTLLCHSAEKTNIRKELRIKSFYNLKYFVVVEEKVSKLFGKWFKVVREMVENCAGNGSKLCGKKKFIFLN